VQYEWERHLWFLCHGEATVNGKTFGPNESVVTQCVLEKVTVDDLVKRDVSEAKALMGKIKERKQ